MKNHLYCITVLLAILFLVPPSFGEESSSSAPFLGTLMYAQQTGDFWQVWRKDLMTGETVQLTESAGDKRHPSWRNDAVTFQTNNDELYILDEGTSQVEQLFKDLWPVKHLAPSPDGTLFAFARFHTEIPDQCNLWISDRRTGERRMVTREAGIQYEPAWSPDGKKIAYSAGHGYGTYEIFVMNADGTEKAQLTKNTSYDLLPAWSPDGTKIAFVSNRTEDYEMWVMNADGTHPQQLTTSPGLDTKPTWSPDGNWLAFTTNRSGKLEIWAMRSDGSEQRVLVHGESEVCDPSWY